MGLVFASIFLPSCALTVSSMHVAWLFFSQTLITIGFCTDFDYLCMIFTLFFRMSWLIKIKLSNTEMNLDGGHSSNTEEKKSVFSYFSWIIACYLFLFMSMVFPDVFIFEEHLNICENSKQVKFEFSIILKKKEN